MKKVCIASGIALILLEGIFALWLIPAHSRAAEGRPAPDMQTMAPPVAIKENLAGWNTEAREIYRWFQLTDTLFPLAYGAFLFSALFLLTGRMNRRRSELPLTGRLLPALPLLGMAADYVENGAVRWVLMTTAPAGRAAEAGEAAAGVPEQTPGFLYPLITAAGSLKMAVLGISAVLTAGLFILHILRKRKSVQ